MKRQIKFEFLYRGMRYSAKNNDAPWFKKHYTLDQLIGKPLHDLSDVHSFSELVAKRQFTGLTGKNGVEIYEGDFLKMDDLIVPVIFEDGSFQIKTNGYQGASHLMQDRARRFVVCGNIYQNQELLNDTAKSK